MRTKRSTAEPPSGGRPTKRQRAMLAHRCTGEPLSEANTPHTMKTRTRNDSSTLKKSSGSIHMSLPKEQAPEKISKDPSSTHDVRLTKRQRALRAPIPVPLSRGDLRYTDRISGPNLGDTLAGHYEYDIGDNLTPRFKIMRTMGEGTFGRVVECWDRKQGDYVAIKIIRSVPKYRDAAMLELQALSTLAANDPNHTFPIVRLSEWFDYRDHVCMVFARLGPSIYDCLRLNHYKPFPIDMVKSFMHQLLQAVSFMHRCLLIHTDLKPENVLFIDKEFKTVSPPPGSKLARQLPPRSDIRLIDFGSATFEEDYHSNIVSTRHYRAPEIILGLGWSRPCDMWSLGCILVELVTGDALFQTHENAEHLAMMETVLGATPESMAKGALRHRDDDVRTLYDSNTLKLAYPRKEHGKKSINAVKKMRPLKEYLRAHGDDSLKPYLDDVADLASKMMRWSPETRCSADEALMHPLFHAMKKRK